MKSVFVKTKNVRRFHQAFIEVEQRGAVEQCLMVLDGEPGTGKTTALHEWAARTGNVYLRANKEWTPMWFMGDMLNAFRVQPDRSFEGRFKQVVTVLLDRQHEHEVRDATFAVVIDEADHVSIKPTILETIRDLSDGANIPFVLVGMGRIRSNLRRFPQVASRVKEFVNFEPADLEDVKLFLEEKCDFRVDDDLAAFIWRVSEGFNREIMDAIAAVERFGQRNRPEPGEAITLADMSGQKIVNARQTGAPISVPAL